MKKLFRRAITVLGTAALIGATVGAASAAAYPSPFTSNSAIVVGASAAPSDNVAATDIAANLNAASAGTTTTTVEGGEVFDLYKDNDKLHFGDAMNAIMDSALDDNDMTALADGDYDSGDIDVEYTQTVTLGSKAMSLITDTDLNDEEPTIGYHFDDEEVLTYKLSLKDTVKMTDMKETDLPLFGRDYYVLDATSTKITLLNSAEKTIVAEGESVTVDGHTVSIDYITDTSVKFSVDGESTDKLSDGDSYELADEYHIVASEILYTEKDGSLSKVEFSLGSGKVVLETAQDIEVNDDGVDGLVSTFTTNGTAGYLDAIEIEWSTDGDVFLTEGDSINMPVFDEFGVVFNGLSFGSSEKITLDNGETLVLNMENYDLDVMYNTTTDQYLGGKNAELVSVDATESTTKTFGIAKDQRFLATILKEDVSDVETAYYEVASINNDTAEFDLKLNDMIGTDDVEFTDASTDDDEDFGSEFNVKVLGVYDAGVNATALGIADYLNARQMNATNITLEDVAILNITSDETIHWDMAVSEEGMVIQLPTTAGVSQEIIFYETDKDGDIDTTPSDEAFALETAYDSDDKLYAKVKDGMTMVDETADDKTVGYDAGVHATKVMEDSDAHTLEVEYYADEVSADLKVIAGGEATTSTEAGVMTVTDAEVASVAGKNLVVIGGSAINSVAAELLGGAYRGAEFTEMTGVADGQFLIQSFDRSGAVALLVAGYSAADTTKAATYLINEDVDTTVGTKMVGTSATEATVVTA